MALLFFFVSTDVDTLLAWMNVWDAHDAPPHLAFVVFSHHISFVYIMRYPQLNTVHCFIVLFFSMAVTLGPLSY